MLSLVLCSMWMLQMSVFLNMWWRYVTKNDILQAYKILEYESEMQHFLQDFQVIENNDFNEADELFIIFNKHWEGLFQIVLVCFRKLCTFIKWTIRSFYVQDASPDFVICACG